MKSINTHARDAVNGAKKILGNKKPTIRTASNHISNSGVMRKIGAKKGESPHKATERFANSKGIKCVDRSAGAKNG